MKTTAEWMHNDLMVSWYGGDEDEAAFWVPKRNHLIFEGNDEDFVKHYDEKPTAEKALADIMEWQNQG